VQSRNVQGKVITHAITVHCQNAHQAFMVPFITRYFENAATKGQFVAHSMQFGHDPQHLKARYYFAKPISVQCSNAAGHRCFAKGTPTTDYSRGRRNTGKAYRCPQPIPIFSSIEPTPQSEKIGKYLFITTQDKFEAAKNWINTELPQIWVALDHNFLDELPDSVQCPCLTTSNLKDATTSKMVAMLNASKVPDDATIASKWSMPPQIGRNKNPPNTITVNYTPSHFPTLPKQNPRQEK
jgi:hypothetical protein